MQKILNFFKPKVIKINYITLTKEEGDNINKIFKDMDKVFEASDKMFEDTNKIMQKVR